MTYLIGRIKCLRKQLKIFNNFGVNVIAGRKKPKAILKNFG